MSETAWTLRDAARILDEAVRDETYKEAPLGQEVDRFLRYLRTSRDASPRTIEDYESVLARFSVDHAHLGWADLEGSAGAERIIEWVARRYRGSQPGTRRKIFAILSSFCDWAVRFDRLSANTVRRIDRPRKRGVERHAHSPERIREIIDAQPELRDRVAIALMARLGLRKNELRTLRWRDVDLRAGELRVHAKGGKRPTIPVVYDDLLEDLARLSLEADSDEYLLYPVRIGNLPSVGVHGIVREHRDRPMQPSTMHRWFKRCLAQAGAADFPMHELRHSAITELILATDGNLAAGKQFARHATIATTIDIYSHLDRENLLHAMRLAGERWDASAK